MQLLEGEETYQIQRSGESLVLRASSNLVDLGVHLPLVSTLRMRFDYTPEEFQVEGQTSGDSHINTSISIHGQSASVSIGTRTESDALTRRFFTISGYAPVSI
jgi:hypothetical protein